MHYIVLPPLNQAVWQAALILLSLNALISSSVWWIGPKNRKLNKKRCGKWLFVVALLYLWHLPRLLLFEQIFLFQLYLEAYFGDRSKLSLECTLLFTLKDFESWKNLCFLVLQYFCSEILGYFKLLLVFHYCFEEIRHYEKFLSQKAMFLEIICIFSSLVFVCFKFKNWFKVLKTTWVKHRSEVNGIIKEFQKKQGLVQALTKDSNNKIRETKDSKISNKINLKPLHHVIEVDFEDMTCWAESGCSFGDLAT